MKLPYSYPTLSAQTTIFGLGQQIVQMFQRISLAFNEPDHGTTTSRPTLDLTVGQTYFDDDLGKPIWWDSTQWVDGSGTPV